MTNITTHEPVTDKSGRTRLVPISRKARLAKLPKNKQIAATYNETKRVKPGSRALAQSIPELERKP